jgi:threonine dehydratase
MISDEICAAIKMGFNDTRCVLEPAGALAIAGMVKYIKENKVEGSTFVAISSGANMDFDRLRFVSERADSGETLMAIAIPEQTGIWSRACSLLVRAAHFPPMEVSVMRTFIC